jgi:TolB protein
VEMDEEKAGLQAKIEQEREKRAIAWLGARMRETIVIILTVSVLCLEIAAQPVGKISYQSSEDWQIYIMDVESGERTKITDDMRKTSIHASLSNGGSRIAMSVDLDRDGDREIHIIDISSGRRWRLTSNPWNENDPRWSPDDNYIAFTANPRVQKRDGFPANEFPAIYKIHVDGTQQQRVAQAQYPSWSPDGKWIAFSKGSIYKIRHSDKLTVRITNDDSFLDDMSAFSPDGKKVAFVSSDQKGTGDPLIYVADIDTGKRIRLTEFDGDWHLHPCWSPDGKHVAFESTITESISIMNDDGGNERILIENASYPSWSPCRPYAVLPHHRTLVPWGALKALWRFR